MGMFNSIYSNILCPVENKISKDTEIQIKWQDRSCRGFSSYKKGDTLEELAEEYNNKWIRTDYICNVCSKFTDSKNGYKFIKVEDQSWHYVFIKIEGCKIIEILSEKEFENKNIKDYFIDY
jgi:hypothetical protein